MNRTALTRLRRFMASCGFERFTLCRPENFAWLTGGGDNTVAIGEGVGCLEVTPDSVRLHTSRIEAARLQEEEKVDFAVSTYPWYSSPPIGRPNDFEHDLTPLRLVLTPEEQERFRRLGNDAAQALGSAMQAAQPEWTEARLAGEIAAEAYARGIQPVVLLVAGEERAFRYRHPLPKDRALGKLAMGVICARRDGLVANLTRMRSWGKPGLARRYEKLLRVEARGLDAAVPGATLGEVLEGIAAGYREIRAPDEFEAHHQGGIAGYRPREVLGVTGDGTVLQAGMAVAWNPSLPGVKVEDTFLITPTGLENLTFDPDWPMIEVGGRPRPAVLTEGA